MPEWLAAILSELPSDTHWSTRRRMAILHRWPQGRQLEAHHDAANGKPGNLATMNDEIAAIKAAIPKS